MEACRPIRVLCADDQPDMRLLLQRLIDDQPDMTTVGALDTADELVEQVGARKPDVVVLDLTMPGRHPLEALRELSLREPKVRVLVMSGYDDPATVDSALDAGAWTLVSKHDEPRAVLKAIREAMA